MSSSVRTNSKSSLFLIELIVTLCFFSLASVVCVRLFVYAHKVSTESRRETLAIQISQNAAECFIAADGDPVKISSRTLPSPGRTEMHLQRRLRAVRRPSAGSPPQMRTESCAVF